MSKYSEKVQILEVSDNYELVKVGKQKHCYQVNNTEDINSPNWFCYGAWETLEAAKEFFLAKSSKNLKRVS